MIWTAEYSYIKSWKFFQSYAFFCQG